MRKVLLLLSISILSYGNVCTNANLPANGPFPAIVNGVDALDSTVVRISWFSDFSPSAATISQVKYATATEWSGSPGVYPHSVSSATTASSSTEVQIVIISNLIPATVYHFLPQSLQGSLCSNSDSTFTTLAFSTELPFKKPLLPTTIDTTRPSLAGTHWDYGNNCGLSGTVTAKWQDCLNKMVGSTGDYLTVPPGVYPVTQINTPNSDLAVNVTCSTGTNLCTVATGSGPANGTFVKMGGQFFGNPPSPINPGIPYQVINPSHLTSFALTTIGGSTPITLLNNGNLVAYLPYPLTQPKMVIKPTTAASLLPPVGVGMGPNDLSQYRSHMVVIQGIDPLLGGNGRPFFQLAPLTVNLVLENISLEEDPSVATGTGVSAVNPPGWPAPVQVGLTNEGIIFDQVAFPKPTQPSRVGSIIFNGMNNAIVNSFIDLDWWQPHYRVPSMVTMSISGNVITIPAATISYVGSAGTKVSCSIPAGTVTISGGGSGSLLLWTNPNCSQGGSLSTGLAAATTITGLTITNSASPSYPTYTYTSPTALTQNYRSVIPLSYPFTITSGVIQDTNTTINQNWFDIGKDDQRAEGSSGIEVAAWGPFKFDNLYIRGSGITGIFFADDLTLQSTPCGGTNPCPIQYNIGNYTITRSTMTTDVDHYSYDSPHWDGGNRYWRQINEQKQGNKSLWDGLKIGPYFSQVGAAQCGLHEEFANFILIKTVPPVVNSSNWTFSNSTCFNVGSNGITTAYSFQGGNFGYPMQDLLVDNVLFYNNNGYAQTAVNQPFRSDGHVYQDPTQSTCPAGTQISYSIGQNFINNHITSFGVGGCQPMIAYYNQNLSSSVFSNSIMNLVQDPNGFNSATLSGFFFNNLSYGNDCVGDVGGTLLSCIHNLIWGGNSLFFSYTNSFPGSMTEFNTSQINSVISTYFSGYTVNAPNDSTLAQRISKIGWLNASLGNFRLGPTSVIRSAAKLSLDGRDIGINQDRIDIHQGNVNNVRSSALSSTSLMLNWTAPNTFNCIVDWGTTSFFTGSGTWTRDTTTNNSRIQTVTLTGLPAHGNIFYKINCEVMQPTGSVQLP